MDRITLQNYRCFGSEEQSARLAPLTLLVGPNSTGKTSFLALIRALWDVAFREVVPNFREEPYDLGSWDDIVHQPGGRSKPTKLFGAGFEFEDVDKQNGLVEYLARFEGRTGFALPTERCLKRDDKEVRLTYSADGDHVAYFRSSAGEFSQPLPSQAGLFPFGYLADLTAFWDMELGAWEFQPLIRSLDVRGLFAHRPFANSSIRSRPHRTYNPTMLVQDTEGDYIPSYFAALYRRNADGWQLLKRRLEEFGKLSELFDEISVRSFGKSDGDPFQIQVRKFGKRRKGPWRNLIDVGYGVSQALPVLTELLRPDGPTMFLLQQPEVHLHPQAQAALGTLFCQTAAAGRQLVIETHSDYIIDRVRMDVRDGTTGLRPEDVSVLYFEPGDLAVKIHSIWIDEAGNIKDAPEGYRQFFTDETMRSIWA